MKTTALASAAIALAAFATAAGAQDAKTGDARVGALLKQAGIDNCKVDNDGDWLCGLKVSDTRTEAVWISSKTNKLGDYETRKIFSIAYMAPGPLSAADANSLLSDNAKYNFGAWQVGTSDGKSVVMFAAEVGPNVDATTLLGAVGGVALVADNKEQEKTGKDEY
jgi:hypothetical protein